jgi:hypothetical protein
MTNRALAVFVFATVSAPAVTADGLNPGSVLVYPIQRTALTGNPTFFSIVSVTNINLTPSTPQNGLGGSTNIHWEYVNTVLNPANSLLPLDCQIVNRTELLTPADTRTILTNCHNGANDQEGYLVISAEDPNGFATPWSHNYLVGNELVINGNGIIYYVNAIPFESPDKDGTPTDHDLDGQLDFDGLEYEGIPDHLFLDIFTGGFGASIVLINMSGGPAFTANVAFDAFNDNEQPLSATVDFKCWMEERLDEISLIFTTAFLLGNTQQDPTELDVNCDQIGDLETGWSRIRGNTNSSSVESYPNPALLGAFAKGLSGFGGRRMWETLEKQTNGDFMKTGTDDPEFP